MTRRWVVNSSPLIVLAKISKIHLLIQLCGELVIPMGVVQEINCGVDNDPARIWLAEEGVSWIRDIGEVAPVVAAWNLGVGESEVMSWVYRNSEFEAILDDRAAKDAAMTLRIPVRGTLGVILLAKREGIVPAAKPLFEELVQVGFRVSPELLTAALRLVDE